MRYFDIRILTIDTAEPEHFLTSEKKNVLVDLFVKWRITDVRQYYRSIVQGGGSEMQAQTRLLQTINDGLRAEFGNRTVHDVVSGERDKIMELMRAEGERGRGQDRRGSARRAVEARRPAQGSEPVASTAGWRPSASRRRTSCGPPARRSPKESARTPTASAR